MLKIISIFFLAKLILIFLESSESYFDLDASKIETNKNNLLIYGVILVNFPRILSTKAIISRK